MLNEKITTIGKHGDKFFPYRAQGYLLYCGQIESVNDLIGK